MITVTIRGGDDDVQQAKKTIEEMTVDLLTFVSPDEPVVRKEYEIIDWKAAAMECVSLEPIFKLTVRLTTNSIHFEIGRGC